MAKSKIQWTDVTDNVVVVQNEEGKPSGWYCEKISPGCDHCYAERLNGTPFYGGNGLKYVRSKTGVPDLMLRREILEGWKRETKPKRHFVNSMTDTFGSFVPEWWIDEILWSACQAPKQTFQFLTKRPARMLSVVLRFLRRRGLDHMPLNIWLGCSVENQKWADNRVEDMTVLSSFARTWVSYEPALGAVDWNGGWSNISWMVCGGESGHEARPMHPDWAIKTRDWCREWEIPFFFKQWGEWVPMGTIIPPNGSTFSKRPIVVDGNTLMLPYGKHRSGRLLDGREWNEFPNEVK